MSRTIRLEEIHVDGFGMLADELVGPLTPGVNVILGPNEAGKSTLLAFVRAALFGFERRNGPTSRYEPMRGGRHGGDVSILDDGGALTRVERRSGSGARSSGALRVIPETGTPVTGEAAEATLATLLGGMSQRLYQNIFAFGLGELQQLGTLQDEEVNAYIYTAGMGLAARVIPVAERHLDRRLDDLFRPRGKKQVINHRLSQLDEMESRLSRLAERPDSYNRLVAERALLNEQVEAASQELKRLDAQNKGARRLLDAWEPWQELLANREERERLAVAAGEAGLHDAALLHRGQIELLSKRKEVATAELDKLAGIQVRHREALSEWESELATLGVDWDADRVTSFDGSVAVKEEARTHRDRLQRTKDERERKAESLQQLPSSVPWTAAAAPGAIALLMAAWFGVAPGTAQFPAALGLLSGLSLLVAAGWLRHRAAARREREEALRDAQRDEEASRAAWTEWLRGRRLSEALSPQGVLDLVAEVERARSRWERVSEFQRQHADSEGTIRSFILEVAHLAGELAKPSPVTVDEGDVERQAEQALQAIDRLRERLRVALKRQADADRLDERRGQLESQLYRTAGSPMAWDEMEAELRRSTPDAIQSALDERETLARQLATENAERQTRLGAVGQEIQEIERDEEAAALRWERVSTQAKLQSEARTWAVFALTRALFRTARAQYERERQPGVLRRAAELFSEMTDGRYRGVVAPFGESTLQVERADGERLGPDALSRGTAEQLYLAMRLALAQEFAARSVALPIVMDDPLVNFDHDRLRAAARVIAQFAASHQVLLFTCHPHVADAFRGGSGQVSIHSLATGRREQQSKA